MTCSSVINNNKKKVGIGISKRLHVVQHGVSLHCVFVHYASAGMTNGKLKCIDN